MAIAPTASIGLVAGTTPGLDPQFSQIFSRATSAGKFLEVNRNLVADLKVLGLWEEVREDLLRAQGDVTKIAAVPDEIKAIYRTSFQLSPYAFLERGGPRAEVDRPGDQPEHVPGQTGTSATWSTSTPPPGAMGVKTDLLPAHDAAAHRRAEHRARSTRRPTASRRTPQRPRWRPAPSPGFGGRAASARPVDAEPGVDAGRRRSRSIGRRRVAVAAVEVVPSWRSSTAPYCPSTRRNACSATRASEHPLQPRHSSPPKEDDHDPDLTDDHRPASSAPASRRACCSSRSRTPGPTSSTTRPWPTPGSRTRSSSARTWPTSPG